MSRKMSDAEIKGLRNLMKGNGHDKLIAERTLIEHGPEDLPEDILDVWVNSKHVRSKERGNRVLRAWGRLEDDQEPATK